MAVAEIRPTLGNPYSNVCHVEVTTPLVGRLQQTLDMAILKNIIWYLRSKMATIYSFFLTRMSCLVERIMVSKIENQPIQT